MGPRTTLLAWLSPPPPLPSGGIDETRRSRLIVYFSFLGAIFGALYSVFYLLIGHPWGALIIVTCAGLFLASSHFQPRIGVARAANLLAGTMTVGFTALASIEGGLLGHAVAWIMAIPLIALLLCGERSAMGWLVACLGIFATFVGLQLARIDVPFFYSPRWAVEVTVAGYTGVILFLFLVGLIFERGRAAADAAMRQALEELADANRNLHRLNQEKSEFLNIAAHDLKGPLGAIGGYAEMIEAGMASSPEEAAAWARQIMASSRQMLDLITRFLDVNAIEEGRLSFVPERCDLPDIVDRVVQLYRRPAERKGIPLRWEAPLDGADLAARTDPRAALQIVDNLVSNAVKYSPHGSGPVVVRIGEKNGSWTVEVEDSGPGLSAEDQAKLFGRFTRLTPRPTGGETSSGIGLAIARQLAEDLGGGIECRSILGAGSLFTAAFPKWEKTGASES